MLGVKFLLFIAHTDRELPDRRPGHPALPRPLGRRVLRRRRRSRHDGRASRELERDEGTVGGALPHVPPRGSGSGSAGSSACCVGVLATFSIFVVAQAIIFLRMSGRGAAALPPAAAGYGARPAAGTADPPGTDLLPGYGGPPGGRSSRRRWVRRTASRRASGRRRLWASRRRGLRWPSSRGRRLASALKGAHVPKRGGRRSAKAAKASARSAD